MAYYKTCSDCGSHLDPGELCNCLASHRPGRNETVAVAPVNYLGQNSNRSILNGSNNIGVPMPGKWTQAETLITSLIGSDKNY